MDFEYTGYIYIEESDLKRMFLRVKKGEDFQNVYSDIMSEYDDSDYYVADYVEADVKKEIDRRLKQARGN